MSKNPTLSEEKLKQMMDFAGQFFHCYKTYLKKFKTVPLIEIFTLNYTQGLQISVLMLKNRKLQTVPIFPLSENVTNNIK